MKLFALLFSLVISINIQLAVAKSDTTQKPLTIEKQTLDTERLVEYQMKKIGELLDPLMLENDPKAEFTKMIPQIKQFSTVTKVDFKGSQFYIEFTNGSTNYWDLPN